jgi:hypothetical protein
MGHFCAGIRYDIGTKALSLPLCLGSLIFMSGQVLGRQEKL